MFQNVFSMFVTGGWVIIVPVYRIDVFVFVTNFHVNWFLKFEKTFGDINVSYFCELNKTSILSSGL